MAQFPFVGGAYRTRSKNFAAERCINLYPEVGSPTSKTVAALYGTPGLRLWATLEGGSTRGLLRFNATTAIVVSGPNVYKVSTAGVGTLLGAIVDTGEPVSMASNGSIVMVANGATGYFIDPIAGTVSPITDDAFPGASSVAFIDGYFVFSVPGTGRFMITQLYGTDIDGLDFATAEGSPDLLLSLLVDHREIWLFGEDSTEVFFNGGNADFPFERINGAFIEQGCAAKRSPAKLENAVYWLASDERGFGTVQRAQGYTPQRVSDHGVEYAISKMPRIDDAVSYTYQQEGHSFYVLNFPTAQQTWVFDVVTGLWHQRAWRNPATTQLERHRAQNQMFFAGETIVGDWENGKLYVLDMDYFTDNGDPIVRVRVCPHLADANYRWQVFNWLQVDFQMGVGESGDPSQATDPQAMLQWSDDGGYAWSNEHWVSLGKIGERTMRARWRRLGRSRDRLFKLEVTDPVRVAVIGAAIDVVVGAA